MANKAKLCHGSAIIGIQNQTLVNIKFVAAVLLVLANGAVASEQATVVPLSCCSLKKANLQFKYVQSFLIKTSVEHTYTRCTIAAANEP